MLNFQAHGYVAMVISHTIYLTEGKAHTQTTQFSDWRKETTLTYTYMYSHKINYLFVFFLYNNIDTTMTISATTVTVTTASVARVYMVIELEPVMVIESSVVVEFGKSTHN